MKTTRNIFFLFLATGFLMTACTDSLTGPETDLRPQDQMASASATGPVADLSVQLELETDSLESVDAPFVLAIHLNNAGPDAASGVQLGFKSDAVCYARSGGGTDNKGGDIDLGFDIINNVLPGTSQTFEVECEANGLDVIESTVEVLASDASDPDSTPGNFAPEEDDQDTRLLSPDLVCEICSLMPKK